MDRHHYSQVNHLFSSAANSLFGSIRDGEVVGAGGSSHVARTDTCTINPFMKREQQHPGCPGGDVNQQLAPSIAVTNDHDKNYFFRSQQDMGRRHEEGDDVAEPQGNNIPLRDYHVTGSSKDTDSIKAKIIVHPQYASLLEAYKDCQKIGAPPEIAERLSAVSRSEWEQRHRSSANETISENDPELDQFMGAYYDMLVKYREELSRPLQEAMQFLRNVESQLNSLRDGSAGPAFSKDDRAQGVGSSEKGGSGDEETELVEVDPQAEETELKERLLKKYSGYLGSLKLELNTKKKNGKLPKESRQKLLNWWELHYKWPYPSESEKVSLAESTGLDQKQIKNWFINQRKRHWKPSDNRQFGVMDGPHPRHNTAPFFVHNQCTMGGAESSHNH